MNKHIDPNAISELFDRLAPPVSVQEIHDRRPPGVHRPGNPKRRLIAASLAGIVLLAAVGIALILIPSSTDVDTVAPAPSPQPTDPLPNVDSVPTGAASGWPTLLTATQNVAEVLAVIAPTGAVIDAFRPEELAGGGISGATGSPDGRIAMWAGARVVIRAGSTVFTLDLASLDDAVRDGGGELRVSIVPSGTAVWITQSTGPNGSRVWMWNYLTDEVDAVEKPLPQGLIPAGVTDDGRLVLNRDDPSLPRDSAQTVTFLGPTVVDNETTVSGSAIAVHRNSALIRNCSETKVCELSTLDLSTATSARIDTGDVDADRVISLIGPTIPAASAPLDVGDPSSSRVTVGVRLGDSDEPDQPTVLGVVDLESGILTLPADSPDDIVAAVWDCEGSDIALLRPGQTIQSLNEAFEPITLNQTFLYGTGAC